MMESVEVPFRAFYERWVIKQQEILEEIHAFSMSSDTDTAENDQECRELIEQVFDHYNDYFREKNRAAHEDVFLVLSPPWLSSFERALIWVSCFKPSMVFPLINNSIGVELSAEQFKEIQKIEAITRKEEGRVDKVMADIQGSVSRMTIDGMLREHGRLVDGEESRLVNAIEELKSTMLVVMENADGVRASTLTKVFKILKPYQTIKFLAAATRFLIHMRSCDTLPRQVSAAEGSSYVGGDNVSRPRELPS